MLQMLARRDLRHDAAERLMAFDLRGDEIDAHAAVRVEDGDGGFVAGGFNAEDHVGVRNLLTGGTISRGDAEGRRPIIRAPYGDRRGAGQALRAERDRAAALRVL